VVLDGLSWTEQKCGVYQRAWGFAYDAIGPYGICPRTPEEVDLANMLTLMTMNERMESTFVPFTCRQDAK
jgi:hypothetical protein